MSIGLKNSWPLFLGMLMLMIGNGLQGTLLGVRGGIEGFNPDIMSLVMAGYYIGILGGSKITPLMINRVGHVRVFAALASLISACFILFPVFPSESIWFLLRVVIGFCFSGVYVVSESWLNDVSTNSNRGKILSFYLIIQTLGIVLAQIILNFADPTVAGEFLSAYEKGNAKYREALKKLEKYKILIRKLNVDRKKDSKLYGISLFQNPKRTSYDYVRGELSSILVTNKVNTILQKWFTTNNIIDGDKTNKVDDFIRILYRYVTSRSETSAKFVIAK